MRRIGEMAVATLMLVLLPSLLLAHGGHAQAGDGLIHTIMHALPTVAVLLIAALTARVALSALAARGRR